MPCDAMRFMFMFIFISIFILYQKMKMQPPARTLEAMDAEVKGAPD